MTSIPIIDESEDFLRRRAAELTQPREGECLCCYVARLLVEFPCDNKLRHALHYRDVVAPRATGLARRLGRIGGYCDCELFMNGYQLRGADVDAAFDVLPTCEGVRRSLQPCGNWVQIQRR
ncbi:MAG TPA: DUF2695 domain-containing protein [Frankiaceae bacterium]|jgi:hypothetical protein|nr:DUF2695 domain-containing protein [Frankiaceae bacterium]